MLTFSTIKNRSSFVRMNASASRFVVSNFIVQMIENPELRENEIRVGYTVTKKLGGAVVRNRIKRRLREIVRRTLPAHAKPQRDYVFIARHKAATCEFSEMERDMVFALSKIHRK